MATNLIDKNINDFLIYLEIEKGRSRNTLQNYLFYLKRFSEWMQNKKKTKIEDINKKMVKDYRLWLNRLVDKQGNFLKNNTQNYHLIALRAFLKYLAKQDVKALAPEKIELARMPQRQIDFLEGDDLERLLDAPFGKRQDEEGIRNLISLRDKAILEFLFCTGLRVSELINLKKENINFDKDEFTIRGKGSKLRIIFISDRSKDWLLKYLKARKDLNPYLFVSHDRASKKRDTEAVKEKGLTARSVQRIIEKYARRAGITKKVTPHTLRHSYATDLLINGADIRSVQSMLGHSSITTTQVYTHITDKQLKAVHKKFHNKKGDS